MGSPQSSAKKPPMSRHLETEKTDPKISPKLSSLAKISKSNPSIFQGFKLFLYLGNFETEKNGNFSGSQKMLDMVSLEA